MSEKDGVPGGTGASSRLVTKVVITYRLEEDPDRDRTLTLEHGGGGEAMDGIIWSDELIRKIGYLERDGSCTEAKKQTGTGEWKVYAGEGEAAGAGECFWLHDQSCTWSEYCSD